MTIRFFLSLALLASPAVAESIDNCASLLGSISVELRFSRTLPATTRTTFVCPRDSSPLVGASKQRILNSLGTPDASTHADGSSVAASWSYFFGGVPAGERDSGIPELEFFFDEQQLVSSVSCQPTR